MTKARVSRRCGCRDENGKQYSTNRPCPDMADPHHGTWGFRISAGTDGSGKRQWVSAYGFDTEDAASGAYMIAASRAKTSRLNATLKRIEENLGTPDRFQTGRKYTRISDHQRDEIIRLYVNGVTNRAIARQFNTDEKNIRKIIARCGAGTPETRVESGLDPETIRKAAIYDDLKVLGLLEQMGITE